METTMTMTRSPRIWTDGPAADRLTLPVVSCDQGTALSIAGRSHLVLADRAEVLAMTSAPIVGAGVAAFGNPLGYAPKTTAVHRSATGRPPL